MKELGLEILNKIYDFGYEAYIVGGYIRDSLLGITTSDIDITTNATPMELKNIFKDVEMSHENYGSVRINYKNIRFDITTFREEEEYFDNRHPSGIKYVNDLKIDLERRDFTINTICMDKDGKIIDLLDGRKDISNHLIETIIDADISFKRDALRILRAIRFASVLDFQLSPDIVNSIKNNKELLKNISLERKKIELDKIFASNKAKEGIELIKKYDLIESLSLSNLDRIKDYSDIIGIWAMINSLEYPFTTCEKDLIDKVNIVYELDNMDNYVLYKYGVYVNILAGVNKGLNKKDILKKYDELKIKSRDEIMITANEMCEILKKEPSSFIGEIYSDLEEKILKNEIQNDKDIIAKYIIDNYNK